MSKMQVTSVKKGRARGRQRTRPRKAGRKEAAAKTKAKSGYTHTHERQLALGLREGGVAVVGVVCLKTPRTRARQNKLKF